jgi:hypothetical protein
MKNIGREYDIMFHFSFQYWKYVHNKRCIFSFHVSYDLNKKKEIIPGIMKNTQRILLYSTPMQFYRLMTTSNTCRCIIHFKGDYLNRIIDHTGGKIDIRHI